jgi:hypothetical protein
LQDLVLSASAWLAQDAVECMLLGEELVLHARRAIEAAGSKPFALDNGYRPRNMLRA